MSTAFFIEMAWKSALIAGVALLLAALLRSRAPADRAAVLQVALGLLLLTPLVSLVIPALQVETTLAAGQAQSAATPTTAMVELAPTAAAAPAAAPSVFDDPGALIAILYVGGLLMAALRLGAGIITLRRWTADSEPIACPSWIRAIGRAANASGISDLRVRVSADAPAPLSWGWRNAVILIDADSYKRPGDADAILAHEVAHLLRGDWPALMVSRATAALFWFNPLVWLLEREYVRNSEEAADQRAIQQIEPEDYAQALLGCARQFSGVPMPANSIASSDITKRVRAVLDGRFMPSRSRLGVVAACGCFAFAAPVAAVEFVAPARSQAPIAPITTLPVAAAPITAAPMAPLAAAAAPVAVAAAAAAPAGIAPAAIAAVPAAKPPLVLSTPTIAIAEAAAPIALVQTAALAAAAPRRAGPTGSERAEYEAAMREAREAGAEAARAGQRAARAGQRAAAIAQREARRSMAKGADDMERGAVDMVRGSREMAEAAVKLRDPAYREKQIAEAAARGQTVTHQQLIDAIPQMEKGSRDMLKGAEQMRQGAAHMRRQSREH